MMTMIVKPPNMTITANMMKILTNDDCSSCNYENIFTNNRTLNIVSEKNYNNTIRKKNLRVVITKLL